ncbi:MAG TPA: DUF389 domain-containing protein [Bryobacteraceae bacterium]|nr:DUF389 domain-containing protein [Bryobacteraceae bacterium]
MHEVRVSAPDGRSGEVSDLALGLGIREVSVYDVHVHGPNLRKQVVSVEVSTPIAKQFVDALFAAPWFDPKQYSITTRQLRAILSSETVAAITRPMVEPALDVLEDLWQLNHVTPSYIGRAAGAAILLGYGMFHNSSISIVVAAMFLPFLSQVLAIAFGSWAGDWRLARQGAFALSVSILISIAAGAVVAMLHRGPLAFTDFQSPLVAFGISSVIGVAAGLASADDAGRRYLIGVAAAVQYGVFPVWFGTCLVLGFPPRAVAWERIATFAVNVATIAVVAGVVYALAGMRREEAGRFHSKMEAFYGAGGTGQ